MNRLFPLTPVLSDALLPAPEDRLLLRACLKPGESGQQACKAWLRRHAESQNGLSKDSAKAFLPLLLRPLEPIVVDGGSTDGTADADDVWHPEKLMRQMGRFGARAELEISVT